MSYDREEWAEATHAWARDKCSEHNYDEETQKADLRYEFGAARGWWDGHLGADRSKTEDAGTAGRTVRFDVPETSTAGEAPRVSEVAKLLEEGGALQDKTNEAGHAARHAAGAARRAGRGPKTR